FSPPVVGTGVNSTMRDGCLAKIIKAMDALSKNNAVSDYLIAEMEHLIKEIPKTVARDDKRFLKAAEDALSTVKRSLDAPRDQE
ncbi:hypothetical protein JVB34_004851, partial [Escherichia coli]|nr:hypothetical protein [Escherichia coli]